MKRAFRKPDPNELRDLAVYNGRDRIGRIEARGQDHRAFALDGRALGSFPNQKAAIAAIDAANAAGATR